METLLRGLIIHQLQLYDITYYHYFSIIDYSHFKLFLHTMARSHCWWEKSFIHTILTKELYTVERETCNKTSKSSSPKPQGEKSWVHRGLKCLIRLSNLNNSLHQVPVLCWAQEDPRVNKLLGNKMQLKYEISDDWENNFSSIVALSDRVLYIVGEKEIS